jgi:hypothetical protein
MVRIALAGALALVALSACSAWPDPTDEDDGSSNSPYDPYLYDPTDGTTPLQDAGSDVDAEDSPVVDSEPPCPPAQVEQIAQLFSRSTYDLDCLATYCNDELQACRDQTCSSCTASITDCATRCAPADASLPVEASSADASNADASADASAADASDAASCDAEGAECAALAACCSELNTYATLVPGLASEAAACVSNSRSCNEALCAQTIAAVNQSAAGLTPSGICAAMHGG